MQDINGMTAIEIAPVKAKYQDPENCTMLGVRIFNDNLATSCNIYWEMYYAIITPSIEIGGEPSISWVMSTNGNLIISGTDYANWNGNNQYPFTYTAQQLNLTII